jgi:hypothetical protein
MKAGDGRVLMRAGISPHPEDPCQEMQHATVSRGTIADSADCSTLARC